MGAVLNQGKKRGASGYGVKLVRGPVVNLEPHPAGVRSADDLIEGIGDFPRPRAADLFCGAGGFSIGLERAGFDVVLGVDHDPVALETCASVHRGLVLDRDLSSAAVVQEIIDLLVPLDLTAIAGGPPCQPFSRAGRSKIRDLVRSGVRDSHDSRRDLWESYLEIALAVAPPVVMLENVPDMAFADEMGILRTMVGELEFAGYAVHTRIVAANDYGVPQHRQRLLVVAFRDEHSFEWPLPQPEVTVGDAIGDLPPVEGGWRPIGGADGWADYNPEGEVSPFVSALRADIPADQLDRVYDHITRPVRPDDRLAFEAMDATTLYSDLPENLRRYRDDIFDDKYKKLDADGLSRSITAHIAKDGYWYIHPQQPRTLTVREAARLQTFPDHVRFAGPPSAAFRQIGNAVPPRLGEVVGTAALDAMETEGLESSTTQDLAGALEDWYVAIDQLAVPWLEADDPWGVILGELLLGRASLERVVELWPRLAGLAKPVDAIEADQAMWEPFDEQRVLRMLSIARQLTAAVADWSDWPAALQGTDGLPHAVHRLALMAVPDAAPPIIATQGVLRVAARFTGSDVDRRNRGTDGRMAVARMVGSGETARFATAALVELARSACRPKVPQCAACPLANDCATARTSQAQLQLIGA